MTETNSYRTRRKKLVPAILLAGFIAGTLDITAASIQYYIKSHNGPVPVLKFIASGLWGKSAFTGGAAMAACGLILHYVIAFIFTLFFFWIYPKLSLGRINKVITGLVYGIFVWAVMNLGVVPLTFGTPPHFILNKMLVAMLILMFCIGLPISLIAGNYYQKR